MGGSVNFCILIKHLLNLQLAFNKIYPPLKTKLYPKVHRLYQSEGPHLEPSIIRGLPEGFLFTNPRDPTKAFH